MPDNFAVVSTNIAADVALNGTFDVPYPAGTAAASFEGADPNQVILILNNSDFYQGPDHVTATYGASTITVTNTHDTEVWRAGASALVQFPKKPVFADAAATVDKMSAVIGVGMGITPLGSGLTVDQGGMDQLTGKVNELIAAYQAT
jgi:hypothetical protein